MMLLREQMKHIHFSNSETIIIDYILEKNELIKNYSIKTIAKETYTSPSTMIRISKKLGFSGWNEFKEAFIEETEYLKRHFTDIDANIPFTDKDTIMQIAGKIVNLHQESVMDTLSLIQHDNLQKAVQLLRRSHNIHVFAIANLNYAGEEFVFKLNRIHKNASINPTQDNMFQNALMATQDECAVCISYSGETPTLLKTANFLKRNQVPIIAITSLGTNSLSKIADVTLNITTREKSFSKIANYSSLASINIILDVLYSCLFSLNYQKNLDYKLKIAKEIETNRIIDNEIINEDNTNY